MYENARNQNNLFVLTIFISTHYLVFFYDIIYSWGKLRDYAISEASTDEETADLVSSALKAAVDESFKLLVSVVVITSLSR